MDIVFKVHILTEGGRKIGFGHVTRCEALYQALEEIGAKPEFIINGDETVADILRNKNCHIYDWLNEQQRLFDQLRGVDAVIIDSYLTDIDFYRNIQDAVRLVVCIDDNQRIDYPCGIVVNGTICAEEFFKNSLREGASSLLGAQYLPLRQEFWDVSPKKIGKTIENVLVTFGGDDMRNMSPQILKLLVDHYPQIIKTIVVGRGFQNIEQLKEAQDDRTDFIFYPDAQHMKNVMYSADVAISAGGQTLYELARVGVPTVAVALAENQMDNVRGWQKIEFIKYAGWWEDAAILTKIRESLELLKSQDARERVALIGRESVDGQGSKRVVDIIKQGLFASHENG
jgi:UDP-2,4-diacetamido-2,4,6-trideoxy-beta-L-altropyranose hydrolase